MVMTFEKLVAKRRSHRRYQKTEIDPEQVQKLLRAALMSPTSRGRQLWQFVAVDNKTDLEKLADVKEQGAAFIKDAAMAIVVLGNPSLNDCWIEDGSIAAISMQYQAEELGLASCWVQVRGRRLSDGTLSADVVKGILDIPKELDVLCILAFGKPLNALPPHDEASLKWENVRLKMED